MSETKNGASGAPPRTPTGDKLAGFLGPGLLYPGVGKLVQRSGQRIYCGQMFGAAFGAIEHPNSKDAKRTSTRFQGDFYAVDHNDAVTRGAECYLPSKIERACSAALKRNQGDPVSFAVEVWCEPDAEGQAGSPLGYSYGVYDRRKKAENDPVLELAYAAGILVRPSAQLAAPEPEPAGEIIDPETGEILTNAEAAALRAAETASGAKPVGDTGQAAKASQRPAEGKHAA
jgi:hypothetical protein